jgi:hypothetical protein
MASRSNEGKKLANVDGYIHAVSEVKSSPSGVRYFDFKIQERDEKRRAVCFSPDKRDAIKEKEECKSPVRLLNVSPQKRKFEPDSTEYKLTNQSKIMVTKNLTFPWADMSELNKQLTVQDVYDTMTTGDIVSVKAKVVWKGEMETVYSRSMRKELTKCEIVLADSTGAIIATVWEDTIPHVCDQKSYVWSNLKVGFYKRKCLNGTKDCTVTICEDISLSVESSAASEQLKPKKKETEDVTGRIVAVDVNKFFLCMNCKNRLASADDSDAEGEFIDCSPCKLRMLKENLDSTVSGSVIIVDESGENLGRFYCQENVLNVMFQSVAETENYNISESNVTQLSRNMITDTLLLSKKVSFKILSTDKLVVEMKVVGQ